MVTPGRGGRHAEAVGRADGELLAKVGGPDEVVRAHRACVRGFVVRWSGMDVGEPSRLDRREDRFGDSRGRARAPPPQPG